MTVSIQQSSDFRPATAKLVARMLAPLMDCGTITVSEYDMIATALKSLGKNPSKEPSLKLISAQEAAELLGISFSQFRALEKEGAFPFARKMVGNKTVRYRNVDIFRYMMSDDSEQAAMDRGKCDELHSVKSSIQVKAKGN